jgi:hypothetical protein
MVAIEAGIREGQHLTVQRGGAKSLSGKPRTGRAEHFR